MVNAEQHVEYWRNGAVEDLAVAKKLVRDGHGRHGLFFAHLVLEKLLKAHVCRHTKDLAPRTHELNRLAERAGLDVDDSQARLLGRIDDFNIEGRYPEFADPPTREEAREIMHQVLEMVQWLTDQF